MAILCHVRFSKLHIYLLPHKKMFITLAWALAHHQASEFLHKYDTENCPGPDYWTLESGLDLLASSLFFYFHLPTLI